MRLNLLQTNPVSAIMIFIFTTEKNSGKLLKTQQKTPMRFPGDPAPFYPHDSFAAY